MHSSVIYILHGWAVDPENQKKWQPLISSLAEKGIEARFLPIPGLSTQLDEVWNLSDYERWLEKELVGQSQVTLLGHSFGGQLAIRYTVNHSQQISNLILIDASGMRPRTVKARLKRSVFMNAAKIGQAFTRSESVRNFLYKLAREKDYQQASPLLRKTMANVLNDEIVKDLPKIKVPALLIWGENDAATPVSHGRFYAQQITDSQLKIIPEARHSPQFTHVDQVTQLIVEYIKNKG
jgi:pimeloyl-ACP methyl ester carboxylesterase